jgi:hypothetical protein
MKQFRQKIIISGNTYGHTKMLMLNANGCNAKYYVVRIEKLREYK